MKQQDIINKTGLILLALGFFIVSSSPLLYGQCRLDKMQHLIYKYDDTIGIKYTEHVFYNSSSDTIYLWIDNDTIGDNSMTMEQKNIWYFQKYIRYPKCEVGLDFLCHDGNINFADSTTFVPVIGCTFIKKILPNELFRIISMNNNFDRKAIHYVKQNIVSHYFNIDILTRFCFDKSFILML